VSTHSAATVLVPKREGGEKLNGGAGIDSKSTLGYSSKMQQARKGS